MVLVFGTAGQAGTVGFGLLALCHRAVLKPGV